MSDFAQKKANETKDATQKALYEKLANYYQRKLWHQLTLSLLELLKLSYWQNEKTNKELQDFYSNFIKSVESHIAPLRAVQFGVQVADTCAGDEAWTLLERLSELAGDDKEAASYVKSAQASLRLQEDKPKECKKLLDESNRFLSNIAGGDAIVSSLYYRVSSQYYKSRNEALEFYRAVLTYLAHENVDELSPATQRSLATDMALAALVGEEIYNFGELLTHPIFINTIEKEWLGELVKAVNAGDIASFDKIMTKNAKQVAEQPALVNSSQTIREKLSILALLAMALSRGANSRVLSFTEIADTCQLAKNEVELLLMKSLSLDLIRGSIDQVAQQVSITWVAPRVLDMKQLDVVFDRLNEWSGQVAAQVSSIEQQMPKGVLV